MRLERAPTRAVSSCKTSLNIDKLMISPCTIANDITTTNQTPLPTIETPENSEALSQKVQASDLGSDANHHQTSFIGSQNSINGNPRSTHESLQDPVVNDRPQQSNANVQKSRLNKWKLRRHRLHGPWAPSSRHKISTAIDAIKNACRLNL